MTEKIKRPFILGIIVFLLLLGIGVAVSQAQLIAAEESSTCKKPYRVQNKAGNCVWSCAAGTTPDTKSNECACKSGYKETGSDKLGRRVCSLETSGSGSTTPPPTPPPPPPPSESKTGSDSKTTSDSKATSDSKTTEEDSSCKKPYRVKNKAGNCVWSCAAGTQVDTKSNECICKSGYKETGADALGRRVCSLETSEEPTTPPPPPPPPPPPSSDSKTGSDSKATSDPKTTTPTTPTITDFELSSDSKPTEEDSSCKKPYRVKNKAGNCVWSCTAGSTPDTKSNECICKSGYKETGTDALGRRVCSFETSEDVTITPPPPPPPSSDSKITEEDSSCKKPYHVKTKDGRCVWSCAAGTQTDTQSNECVCKSGYKETSTDALGRRICSISKDAADKDACEKDIWDCSDWGACSSIGIQIRNCKLTTDCPGDKTTFKPSETQTCKPAAEMNGSATASEIIPAEENSCKKPYRVQTKDGRCVWSCAASTQPDIKSNECVCKSGYKESGADALGRRMCSVETDAAALAEPEELLKKTSTAEDKVGFSTPVKYTKLETQPDIVLQEVACADITGKTKNSAEIMEFLKLMHKTGTFLPPKDQKCKPTIKTKWSTAVQIALTLADENCGLDVANMPSNKANANALRKACIARAIELGFIENKRPGNIKKAEFYELVIKGANLASFDETPTIDYSDIDADSEYYDIVAQAKFYDLVKTYKKKGKGGYILPKAPLMLKDTLHTAWKALQKSPILHGE